MPLVPHPASLRRALVLAVAGLTLALSTMARAQAPQPIPPWMNPALDPDTRADLMLRQMTLDEKIQLVHGSGWGVLRAGAPVVPGHNGGAGFVPGIPRLHLPDINLADSAVGIRMAAPQSRYATLLPSVIGLAASWDPAAAHLYGAVIGRELRDQGYNMSIGGGVDLIREPRDGRNFEYASEDPLLSGIMVGSLALGVQSNRIMGDIKHYVLNDQETGRNTLNAVLNRRALEESDLLAFQIAIKMAHPAGVMCSYNRVNGDFACENDAMLNQVLKHDWGFQGFVLSDWDGTHSTVKAALAGLDMEQPGGPPHDYFGEPLRQAVLAGTVPQARLDDMVHRIVRSMFATGVIDDPPVRRVVDPFRGRDEAQHIEEEGIVLLQNKTDILPLHAGGSIVVIGAHADVGVISGGGSAQVDAPGGNAIDPQPGASPWNHQIYFPSSPLRYIREHAGATATVAYDDGADPAKAAAAAAKASIAIVFAQQWMSEGMDSATLSLPGNQNDLVDAVAAANPNTIVVLETGGPVSMPWAPRVKAILETWFPGIGGAQAIANILFGSVNPSGKLPVTFPATEAQLPHPQVAGLSATTTNNGMNGAATPNQPRDFTVDYNVEGMAVGYKWFEEKNETPLFPFGFGLSYTRFAYANLKPSTAKGDVSVSFDVRNTGTIAGDEVAQVYVTLQPSAGEPFRKLAAFKRVSLAAGATQQVQLTLDPLVLSTFSVEDNAWHRQETGLTIEVGGSSASLQTAK